jgi:predicted aspartyl protease
MTSFDTTANLIKVQVYLTGPMGDVYVTLALDTGASVTLIRNTLLVYLGFDPSAAQEQWQITTGSGSVLAPRLVIDSIEALDVVQTNFAVLAHTLPAGVGVDGVLGLDFLRDHVLTIDFPNGTITLI